MNFTKEPLLPWKGALLNSTDINSYLFGRAKNCNLNTGGTLFVGSFAIIVAFFVLYQLLRRISLYVYQPRIIVEILVGVIIGNTGLMDRYIDVVSEKSFNWLTNTGLSCYALLLGLSSDVSILAHVPPQAIIAYSSILSTFLVTIIVAPFLHLETEKASKMQGSFMFALCLSLAGTSSPVLTRLLIQAKLNKSDIGQLVIGAGTYTDLVSMIIIAIALLFQENPTAATHAADPSLADTFMKLCLIFVAGCSFYSVMPFCVNWLQKRNPHGKPLRPQDVAIFTFFLFVAIWGVPSVLGYSQTMGCFVIGACFPKKGRVVSTMFRRSHEFMRMILFPMFFCWVGQLASVTRLKKESDKYVFVKFFFLHIMVLIGKLLGALASGILLRFHWHISIAIGLFLNVKGHFHMFIAIFAVTNQYLDTAGFVAILAHIILSILVVPYLANFIIQRAKMETTYPLMALQWFDPNTELRMLVGIHGYHNVQTMINLMEISRGNGFTHISVYVTDMIEMNDNNTAAMFIPDSAEDDHQGNPNSPSSPTDSNITMADESVVSMRDQITNMILSYVGKSGEGIKVHRLLAISTFSNMHRDIYNLSEAVQASLIILPYHKNQRKDGKMGNTHHGFRYVNRKVFRHAPCSVGVLVDRGLGKAFERGSSTSVVLQVAVLFIGGKDDREALAYASQITQHPAVKLTAVRFLQEEEKALRKAKRKTDNAKAQEEKEMNLDNEYFANFYEKQVAHRKVGYLEKHVESGKDIVSILNSLESQHSLFIVGRGERGGRVASFLQSGVSDSDEAPDLGLIGEILADSGFSTTASVLVIQQHFHDEVEKEEFKIIPM